MQYETMRIVDSVLRSDDTISQAERARLISVAQTGLVADGDPSQDRLVRRAEAARLLSRSLKSVDRLAERGILKRVVFPSCKRGAGFRLSQIASLIAGGNTVTE